MNPFRLPEESGDRADQLRRFVDYEVQSTAGAVVAVLIAWALMGFEPWLLMLGGCVAVAAAVMFSARQPMQRGDFGGAVFRLAISNWGIAIVVSAVATFNWPLMVGTALLPAIFVVPYTTEREVLRYLFASFVTAFLCCGLGVLQDFSGLKGDVPDWAPNATLLVSSPFALLTIIRLTLLNRDYLSELVASSLAANDRLVEAEEALALDAEQLRVSRARLQVAADDARRAIGREIQHGPAQVLHDLDERLEELALVAASNPAGAADDVAALRQAVRSGQAELRRLAHGVFPPVLTEHGVGAALEVAADRSPNPVRTSIGSLRRRPALVEAAVYFACSESMSHLASIAPGQTIEVAIADEPDAVGFRVFAEAPDGSDDSGSALGSAGDRVGAVGGAFSVDRQNGAVTIAGRVPNDGAS